MQSEQAAMFEKALQRPRDYHELSPESQWHIDKHLGILDWNGLCPHGEMLSQCAECLERYRNR